MKSSLLRILGLLTFVLAHGALARPVAFPSLAELFATSDLVAIIEPVSTEKATDQLKTAGPKYGPRDPKDYQGMNTRFKISLVLKSSPAIPDGEANGTLTLLHFFFSSGPCEFDGGLFAYFSFPPATLQTIHPNRPKVPIGGGPSAYLAFLKWHPDGRFRPVTGDYDSAPSFRLVSTVFPDRGQYEADDIPGLKAATNSQVMQQPRK